MSVEMKKVKVDDLQGAALDWAVAKAVGHPVELHQGPHVLWLRCLETTIEDWSPTTRWQQAGPLIEKCRVSILYSEDEKDPSAWTDGGGVWEAATPLIAACITIVYGKFGSEVEVPAVLADLSEGLE